MNHLMTALTINKAEGSDLLLTKTRRLCCSETRLDYAAERLGWEPDTSNDQTAGLPGWTPETADDQTAGLPGWMPDTAVDQTAGLPG